MRCIRARISLLPRKKGRKGYVAKSVFRLAKYMFYRLKKLARKRKSQYVSRKLQIIIKYRKPNSSLPANRLTSSSKLKTYKKTVPLVHPADPNFPFVEFWHQLTKKALILQVIEACKEIRRDIFVAAQYISFEATNFTRCHLREWVLNPPPIVDQPKEDRKNLTFRDITMANESTEFTSDYGDSSHLKDEPRLASDGFMEFQDDFVYGKIPMKKTELPPAIKQVPANKSKSKTKTKNLTKGKKKIKVSDLIVFHKRLKGDPKNDAKMRQTKIEEFFKPRTSIDVGATSRGTFKKRTVM